MKVGRKQSKNVEKGKSLEKHEIENLEMWGYDPTDRSKGYTGLAKQQLKDQNAFARGRRMGLEPQFKAIESGKLGKNTADIVKKARHGKTSRNPFSK